MKLFKVLNDKSNIQADPDFIRKGIMIVDDSRFSRNVLRDILINEGFDVIGEARDGLEAVEKAKELRPEFIFLDVEMPRLDGLGAISRLLEQDQGVNIIMCTALGQKKIIVEATKAGAKDYVIKPYRKENITSILVSLTPINYDDDKVIPFQSGGKNSNNTGNNDTRAKNKTMEDNPSTLDASENSLNDKVEIYKSVSEYHQDDDNEVLGVFRQDDDNEVLGVFHQDDDSEVLGVYHQEEDQSLNQYNGDTLNTDQSNDDAMIPKDTEDITSNNEHEESMDSSLEENELDLIHSQQLADQITLFYEDDQNERSIQSALDNNDNIDVVDPIVESSTVEIESDIKDDILLETQPSEEELQDAHTMEDVEMISDSLELLQTDEADDVTVEANTLSQDDKIVETEENADIEFGDMQTELTDSKDINDSAEIDILETMNNTVNEENVLDDQNLDDQNLDDQNETLTLSQDEGIDQPEETTDMLLTEDNNLHIESQSEKADSAYNFDYLWVNRFKNRNESIVTNRTSLVTNKISLLQDKMVKNTALALLGKTNAERMVRLGMIRAYTSNDNLKVNINQPSLSIKLMFQSQDTRSLVQDLLEEKTHRMEMPISDIMSQVDIHSIIQGENRSLGLYSAISDMVSSKCQRKLYVQE